MTSSIVSLRSRGSSAIAEAHGGRVTLDSRPGQGSTFAVVIPARQPGSAAAHKREAATWPGS